MKWCPVLVALERSLLYELPHQLLVCYYSNHICLHIWSNYIIFICK